MRLHHTSSKRAVNSSQPGANHTRLQGHRLLLARTIWGYQTNNVALVGSTLVIAILFQPLRRRVQQGIDRRFYRRKYNAARTLGAFNARLRSPDDIDLTTLTDDLLAFVEETMQPAHVSLWLSSPERSREQTTRMLPRIDEQDQRVS
jgi:hypothetical protein